MVVVGVGFIECVIVGFNRSLLRLHGRGRKGNGEVRKFGVIDWDEIVRRKSVCGWIGGVAGVQGRWLIGGIVLRFINRVVRGRLGYEVASL